MNGWIQAGSVEELRDQGPKLIKGGIVVFYHEDQVHALDNRCPHLGFPLHMGSLCNGILTCHWHHARFDVCSGERSTLGQMMFLYTILPFMTD
ncbi:Rieske (2Fe-2S) protein [Paenibacillus sp. AR247]|uniref:Rieske (2Fe-2S) protein n=1 Tax=Paenibacillus sp. AR247 TaxID=1631599 RepID=UPI0026D0EA55|nr:Rieske (2Fe-2S) protein [Paenibacillus sp. AR247]